jgi:hypothetical protein
LTEKQFQEWLWLWQHRPFVPVVNQQMIAQVVVAVANSMGGAKLEVSDVMPQIEKELSREQMIASIPGGAAFLAKEGLL